MVRLATGSLRRGVGATLFTGLLLMAPADAPRAADFTGAGASFPAPVYHSWGFAYQGATGRSLDYQAVGSGKGQELIGKRMVDFGASDEPMPEEKLAAAGLLQFPAVMGAVVMIVNPGGGASGDLKLSGQIIADIYRGAIRSWSDPAIAALNPGAPLPDRAIIPIHRSDRSGTTFVFSSYLSEVSPAWRGEIGAGTSVSWRTGTGAQGNKGVAEAVRTTSGSIGYVEFVFAGFESASHVAMARLQNRSGRFVSPGLPAFEAAARAVDWGGASHRAPAMIDVEGEEVWPIMSATFILTPKAPRNPARASEVIKFFDWAFASGDDAARTLHYVPLPQALKAKVRESWRTQIRNASGGAVWTE